MPAAKALLLKRLLPLLATLAIQCIFGGYDVLASEAFKHSKMSPLVFVFVRDFGAACLLLGASYYLERRAGTLHQWRPLREDAFPIFLCALTGIWGAHLFNGLALQLSTGNFVGLLAPLAPCVTFIVSVATKIEPMNWRSRTAWGKAAGIGVVIAGGTIVGVVSLGSASTVKAQSRNLILGTVYLVLQKLALGSFPVIQKSILHKYNSLTAAAFIYAAGVGLEAVTILPTCLEPVNWAFDADTGLAFLYAVFLQAALALALISYVNRELNPVILTAAYPLESVVAILLSWAFLGQSVAVGNIVGGGVIAGGLVLLVVSKLKEDAAESAVLKKLLEDGGGEEGGAGEGLAVPLLPGSSASLPPSPLLGRSPRRGPPAAALAAAAALGSPVPAAATGGGGIPIRTPRLLLAFTEAGGLDSGALEADPLALSFGAPVGSLRERLAATYRVKETALTAALTAGGGEGGGVTGVAVAGFDRRPPALSFSKELTGGASYVPPALGGGIALLPSRPPAISTGSAGAAGLTAAADLLPAVTLGLARPPVRTTRGASHGSIAGLGLLATPTFGPMVVPAGAAGEGLALPQLSLSRAASFGPGGAASASERQPSASSLQLS